MQNHDEQQPGRLAEVDQPPDGRVAEDLLRVAQVRADEVFARYAGFDNYRRLLDREGAASPGALAVTGTGSEIEKQLRRVADAGEPNCGPSSSRWATTRAAAAAKPGPLAQPGHRVVAPAPSA
jgi:hypothetical protein